MFHIFSQKNINSLLSPHLGGEARVRLVGLLAEGVMREMPVRTAFSRAGLRKAIAWPTKGVKEYPDALVRGRWY